MLSGFILKNEKSAFLDAQSNNVSSAAISFFEQANVSSLTLAVIGEYFNPDILKYVYGNNNPNGDLLHNFDKGEDFSIVFSKCYTEKIANILVMSRALYRIFNSVENNNWTENDKTYLNWNFNSLFQAIELILAFNETNERKEVKMCKHCLKPFIAKKFIFY